MGETSHYDEPLPVHRNQSDVGLLEQPHMLESRSRPRVVEHDVGLVDEVPMAESLPKRPAPIPQLELRCHNVVDPSATPREQNEVWHRTWRVDFVPGPYPAIDVDERRADQATTKTYELRL